LRVLPTAIKTVFELEVISAVGVIVLARPKKIHGEFRRPEENFFCLLYLVKLVWRLFQALDLRIARCKPLRDFARQRRFESVRT